MENFQLCINFLLDDYAWNPNSTYDGELIIPAAALVTAPGLYPNVMLLYT